MKAYIIYIKYIIYNLLGSVELARVVAPESFVVILRLGRPHGLWERSKGFSQGHSSRHLTDCSSKPAQELKMMSSQALTHQGSMGGISKGAPLQSFERL